MIVKITKSIYEQIENDPAKAEIIESIIRHQLYGEPLDPRTPKSDKRAQTSAENGRKGGRPRGSKKCNSVPKLAEIQQFIKDEHLNVDPRAFFAYYNATGWKTGNEPIRSWQALVRMWHNRRDTNKMSREELLKALKA